MAEPKDPFRPISTKDGDIRHEVPRAVLIETFLDRSGRRDAPLDYGALGYAIDRAKGKVRQGNWAFGRAAETLLRRLRDAGWTELARPRRGWLLTDEGRARRDAPAALPRDRR